MDAPEREFDFWIGFWEVREPDGRVAGQNRITPLFDGRVLREEWAGVSGHRGTSLNAWAADRERWVQAWMDSSGLVLLLEGGRVGEVMVLEGHAALPGAGTAPRRQRITWSLLDGDPERLRQHWEVEADDGSWETVFDGRYHRLPGDG